MNISKITLIFILIFQVSFIQARPLFKNDREGSSYHLNFWHKYWLDKKQLDIDTEFFTDFSPHKQLCEEQYYALLEQIDITKKSDQKYALFHLRQKNLLDDISLNHIINFLSKPKLVQLDINEAALEELGNTDSLKDIEQALIQFKDYQKKRKCLKESFLQFYSSITREKSEKKKSHFLKVLKNLKKNNVISKDIYGLLKKLTSKKILNSPGSLKEYKKKIDFIQRNILPENKTNPEHLGLVDYVSKKESFHKVVPRARLYEKYNQFQIMLLSGVIDRFVKRLDMTQAIGINLIDGNDNNFESIYIDSPLEIYRFLVKYLKYEINELKENHLFKNSNILYTDLIAASFELYQIPTNSIEELVKIEEIWSPRLSTAEKILTWGKLFTQVGMIFIPPPYNYVATLSILVIESFARGTQEQATFGHSLFGDL